MIWWLSFAFKSVEKKRNQNRLIVYWLLAVIAELNLYHRDTYLPEY